MNIQLRDYQQTVYNRCREAYKRFKHIAVWSPTGSGKSIIFMYMIQQAVNKGKRVLVLVTRDTLQNQVAEYCEQFGIPYGIIHGTEKRNNNPVQISIVDSFISRLETFDMVCVDEMHLSAASDFMTCLNYLKEHGAIILGFSATIRRLDGIGLGESAGGAFQTIVRGPEMKWLVDEGYLVDCEIYAPSPPEMISTSGSDFNMTAYMRQVGGTKRISNAVEMWEKFAKHKLTVAFCCSIKDARNVRDEFRAAGYKAETLHSQKKKKQDEILRQFNNRELELLITVDLLSYGVDIPIIECALSLRPTASETLYLQQLGRVLRPLYALGTDATTKAGRLKGIANSRKPVAIVLDCASNVYYHGFPTDKREWTLEGLKNQPKIIEDAVASPVLCMNCGRMYSSKYDFCRFCGEKKKHRKRLIKMEAGELRLLTEDEYNAELKRRADEAEAKAEAERKRIERAETLRVRKKAAKTLEDYTQIEHDLGLKYGWGYINYKIYRNYVDRYKYR